jgi:hypothetical protein
LPLYTRGLDRPPAAPDTMLDDYVACRGRRDPDVAAGDRGDAAHAVASTKWRGNEMPLHAVPMLEERPRTSRPRAVHGCRRPRCHSPKPRRCRRTHHAEPRGPYHFPTFAVPMFDQCVVDLLSDSPNVVPGNRGQRHQPTLTDVGCRHSLPANAVPVLDKRLSAPSVSRGVDMPTAQTSFLPRTATSLKSAPRSPRSAPGTTLQLRPFQRSMASLGRPRPTAQPSFAVANATADRTLGPFFTGTSTGRHSPPSQ